MKQKIRISGESHEDRTLRGKWMQLAAKDYERRWGSAPIDYRDDNEIYIRWKMPNFRPSGWLTSKES